MSKELQMALDGLRRERAEAAQRVDVLDGAIKDLERTITMLHPEAAEARPVNGAPKPLAGLTLRDAAAQLLKGATAPVATRELCNQLLAGGFQTTARNFYMVVYAGLKGMENFTRTQDGAWVWQEGAKAGSYLTDKQPGKAKTASRGR